MLASASRRNSLWLWVRRRKDELTKREVGNRETTSPVSQTHALPGRLARACPQFRIKLRFRALRQTIGICIVA